MGFQIYIDGDKTVAFVILVSFLITFACTRFYTRMARVRGWGSASAGDVHVHHLVVGIFFSLGAGWAGLALNPGSPWIDILGVFFGVGAALTLDEFALWLHLKDVYWTKEGRASIDAVIVAASLGSIVVLGMTPAGVSKSASADVLAISIALAVVGSLVSILKGKFYMGMIGIFIPVIAVIGALRLARPQSYWARKRYIKNERKMAKATGREVKRQARKLRVRDFLGGAPHLDTPNS
jgi:hypothetical protein